MLHSLLSFFCPLFFCQYLPEQPQVLPTAAIIERFIQQLQRPKEGHFIVLASNDVLTQENEAAFTRSEQGKWLAADLAAARADLKVAVFHHPIVTPTTRPTRAP